jgi:hypothetical protein
MYVFDFQKKLQKLNDKLYIKIDERTSIGTGLYSTGIYLKRAERAKVNTTSGDKALIYGQQQKYLRALEKGDLDHYIMGVCLNYVPEYDIFDLAREKLLMPGWRSILLQLWRKKIINIEDAKKVFRCKSLGISDWDNLSFFAKMRKCKGEP